MPRSDEAAAWFAAVYNAVQEIPYGKVTSYGHIARLLGKPECPRQVGICLKHLPDVTDQPNAYYHNSNVPWQRVVNAKGGISPRGPSGASQQATALETEGVQVVQNRLGGYTIDFSAYGWFPDILPSDLAAEQESNDDTADEQ